jgi:branched-subunit amino acid ABC-type transport system permease component
MAGLSVARTVLWCYLLWYLVILAMYFDPSPQLWLTSTGISAIVGVGLLLNAGWGSGSKRVDRWQTFRFFLMPFCVSSFSALVKGNGFVLIFSPQPGEVVLSIAACASFLLLARAAKLGMRLRAAAFTNPEGAVHGPSHSVSPEDRS